MEDGEGPNYRLSRRCNLPHPDTSSPLILYCRLCRYVAKDTTRTRDLDVKKTSHSRHIALSPLFTNAFVPNTMKPHLKFQPIISKKQNIWRIYLHGYTSTKIEQTMPTITWGRRSWWPLLAWYSPISASPPPTPSSRSAPPTPITEQQCRARSANDGNLLPSNHPQPSLVWRPSNYLLLPYPLQDSKRTSDRWQEAYFVSIFTTNIN